MTSISWQDFRQKAALHPQKIVLADGEDPRAVQAAVVLTAEKIALPLLVGSSQTINPLWNRYGGHAEAPCLDVRSMPRAEQQNLAEAFRAVPKFRSLTSQEALQRLEDPLILGCLWLKQGQADGFVGGATRTTTDTLRAVLSIIGLDPQASTLFGFFLIETRPSNEEEKRWILLADCAVIPDPSIKQLAHIGIGAASAYEFLLGRPAKVAFLSFSTLGSAAHPFVDKVRQALQLAREKAPRAMLEGEWQADTALDLSSARIKGASSSPMAGQANVLIAPDLNCGNIAYKLVQRVGGCRAVGPILWGTARPANDLSRGCSVEDIIDAVALTALQARGLTGNKTLTKVKT